MVDEKRDEVGLDLPPEYCNYRDEGCELADSCLNCPFSKCVFEDRGGKRRLLKEQRSSEMARLYRRDGRNLKEISEIFGVSTRTVQRALRESPEIDTGEEIK